MRCRIWRFLNKNPKTSECVPVLICKHLAPPGLLFTAVTCTECQQQCFSAMLPALSVSCKPRQACLTASFLGQTSNILHNFQKQYKYSVSSTECWNHDYTSDHTSINTRTQNNFKINQNYISGIYVSILLRPYRTSFLKLQIPAPFRDQTYPTLSLMAVLQLGCQGSRTVPCGHIQEKASAGRCLSSSIHYWSRTGTSSESPRIAQRVPELPTELQLTLD